MAWLLALIRAIPGLLALLDQVAELVAARRLAREQAAKDARNEAAIKEANKALKP